MKKSTIGHIPSEFELLPPFEGVVHQGCLSCPPVTKLSDMNMHVAVGFGFAAITKNGEVYYSEPVMSEFYDTRILREFEQIAQSDPDNDWRLILDAPLRDREYQRQGFEKWVLVKSGMGFA